MASVTPSQYTIAWICALSLEAAAARIMLDKTHSPLSKPSDSNAYELGELNGHNIVIACLPAGVYGKVSAAAVVSRMRLTFPRLEYGLMVGIGGGVPDNDIRLGDVVVSRPAGKHTGVIQYDYGKAVQGGQFESIGTLNRPPRTLLTHMSQLEARKMTEGDHVLSKILSEALEQNPNMEERFSSPGQHADLLFHSSYHHVHGAGENSCEKCNKEQLIKRKPRDTTAPHIHYGLIASGDQVIKDSETRDRLAKQHGILCFEMEAAGLMDDLPTLAIRGICDYCDSHKQKQWQGYAALTAATYAKLLLMTIPVSVSETNIEMQSKPMRHWMVSLARNPRFVGRRDEITKLEELITMQDGPQRIAITGLGGVGKTQVALELAYLIRDQEFSVFWIPCINHAMIEQMFLHMSKILGLHNNPADVKEQVKTYLSSKQAGKWLLILDNADDTEMWFASSHNTASPLLDDFLPTNEQGRILFTSRNRKLAMKLAPFNVITIPDVDEKTAVNILERTLALTHKDLLKDHSASTALLKHLAFLPLAISQASAYIIKNNISLQTYIALLQEQEQDAIELLSEEFRDPGRYKDIQSSVTSTWLISFKQIQHQDSLAADYLYFMACINPRNISQSLLPQPTSKKQGVDALGLLNAYSFTNGQDMGINMHRLVHISIRNWLRQNALFGHWIKKVANHMQNVFPDNQHTNRELWREYLPHALVLLHESDFILQEQNYVGLIEKVADCLVSDGRYQEAEIFFQRVIRIHQEKAGPENPSTLFRMTDLASTYRAQARFDEAEKLQMQVLEKQKKLLGAKHSDTLISTNNLALTYMSQGRWNEAEKLLAQIVESMKIVLGANHSDTLISMGNLAATYMNQGRWSESEKLLIQVIEIRKTVVGADDPFTLISLGNLALNYLNQGRWNESEKLQTQLIETQKRVLGDGHPDTLTTMGNMATNYQYQGRLDEVEKLLVQMIELRKTVLGPRHPITLTSMARLVSAYMNQYRWSEAEKLQVQVIEGQKAVLGDDHPFTITSMNNLAYIQNSREKLQGDLTPTPKRSHLRKNYPSLGSFSRISSTYNN